VATLLSTDSCHSQETVACCSPNSSAALGMCCELCMRLRLDGMHSKPAAAPMCTTGRGLTWQPKGAQIGALGLVGRLEYHSRAVALLV
jgi:hypothetical protein